MGSIIEMIEAQVRYVSGALRATRAAGAPLDLRPEVQQWSGELVQSRLRDSIWTACDSWYRQDGAGPRGEQLAGLHGRVPQAHARVRPSEYERSPP